MTASAESRELQLVAQIESRHRQPDLCTLYEPDADEIRQMSTWITAKGDAFVRVESMR